MTQLPSTTAILHTPAGTSPLGSYLASLLTCHGNSLPFDLVSSAMTGAMALAAAHPFDPEEVVSYTRGHETHDRTLLDAVLQLTNANFTAPTQRWPRNIDGFGPHLEMTSTRGKPLGMTTEWAAAALTAAGCNPWTGFAPARKDACVPFSVGCAVSYGFGGLADRFLECPTAPNAAGVGTARHAAASPETVLQHVIRNPSCASVLECLLDRGVRVDNEPEALRLLSIASSEAVALLAKSGLPELSPANRAKVESAWKERAGKHELSMQDVEAMQLAAWGSVAAGLSKGALSINRFLGAEWGKNPGGSVSQAYDFRLPDGIPGTDRAQVKAGPQAGQWSVFASAVASRIRQANNQGALGWSVPTMIHREYDAAQGRWITADCAVSPYRGSLKDALGFDWRPGAPIDGIVALGLYGQRGASAYASPQTLEELEQEVRKDIRQFGLATGIDDVPQWARDTIDGAAQFTVGVLKSSKINAARSLLFTWGVALGRQPDLATGIAPERAVVLLQALTSHFEMSKSWKDKPSAGSEASAFDQVAAALFPGLTPQSFAIDPTLSGPQKTAALILALSRANPDNKPDIILSQLHDASPVLSMGDLEVVQAWTRAALASADRQAAQSVVESWKLSLSTPDVGSARRGPRL